MKEINVIKKNLYPKIKNLISKRNNKFKQCVGRYTQSRSKELYDVAPCDRIYFGAEEINDFYKSMGIDEKTIHENIQDAYYFSIPNFNPRAAKDEFTVAVLCIIRYYYLEKKKKELELASIYLAFSGKFYPSIHSGSFPVVQPSQYRYIMEYVVNNELSNRFNIKKEKSIFGVIRSICNTWIDTYGDLLRDFSDEDVVYLIQQLHDRIKSFMTNIASIYYKLYEKKDKYFTYDGESYDEDNFHLADNDSLKIERYVEKTMSYLNNNSVNYKYCKMASDSNVRVDEVKSIIESILDENDNLVFVKELIRIIITVYFETDKEHELSDINFITSSIAAKPNTKNKQIIREKEIIETWLSDNSPRYRKRRSREATKSSYQKSVLYYFVLIIYNSNK